MTRRNITIRRELFTLFIVLFISFMVVFGIVVGLGVHGATKEDIIRNSTQIAQSIRNTIDIYITETNEKMMTVCDFLKTKIARHEILDKDVNLLFDSFINNNSEDIQAIKIVDAFGDILYVNPFSEHEVGNNILYASYIQNATELPKWSDFGLSPLSGDYSLKIAQKFPSGYLVADININSLNKWVGDLGNDSSIIVYDSKGTVILSNHPQHMNQAENHSNQEHVQRALNGEAVTGSFIHIHDGVREEMFGSTLLLNNNWVITVARPANIAFQRASVIILWLSLAGITIFAVGFYFSYYFIKRIEKSVYGLISLSNELTKGNYKRNKDLPDFYQEFNQLTGTFLVMAEKIDQREQLLNYQKEELIASNEELESYNEEIVAMNEELKESQEAALAASKAKSEFLANMSHELRTPLNGILGFSQLLSQTELSKDQLDYIDNVLFSGKHLLQIISDILDFSKIETGHFKLDTNPVDLIQMLIETFNMIKPSVEKKPVDLHMKLDENLPNYIIADALRLNQVLINLLGNAVKFTEKGEILLDVSETKRTDKQSTIKFTVKDTGIGISKEMQDKILDKFTQADSTITRKYGGTGLGLSISNHIVQQMGSQLLIESEKGKGSSFSFEVTFGRSEKGMEEERKKTHPPKSKNFPKDLSVLIVDDDPISAKLLRISLKKNFPSFRLKHVTDGIMAIESYKDSPTDLIFLDIHIPKKEGIEVAREIRAIEKGKKKAVIIGLSADIREEVIEKALKGGMDTYLKKPIQQESLIENINRFISSQ